MAIHDFNSQRLFVDADLAAGTTVACSQDQANYLRSVLRLGAGATLLVFNGRDGEWLATFAPAGKRGANLLISAHKRSQVEGPDIDYLFAPLKRARLDYMVQKATELGVAHLCPVLTRNTVAERVNLERMRANAIEAAEQCGVLHVPGVMEPRKLEQVMEDWPTGRPLIFCDESSPEKDPIARLQTIRPGPISVLIGPEGGFAMQEREMLLTRRFVVPISLGPRIMRADTAAVAALAIVNAVLGDWR